MTTQKYKEFETLMSKPVIMDGNQCECLKQHYRPFILGGDVNPVEQCPNKATVKIISHAEHEKDMPPMFLCDDCLILFKNDIKGYEKDYEIIKIKVKKK
jgi:hypothetical protein